MANFKNTLDYIIEHAIDKEIYVIQQIMKMLDTNKVSYQEWERLLPILTCLIEEQEGTPHIHYKGN